MSLLVVSDRRTESALLAARLRMRGLPVDGEMPRVVLVAKTELEPVEQEIITRVRERGGFVLQLERSGDAPIASALQVAVPAGLDDVAGLAELAWLQALHSTRVWKVELERMPPRRLLSSLKAARDTFVIEASLAGRAVRIEIERGEIKRATYGQLKDAQALRAFEQTTVGTVQIRLADAALKAEPLSDANAGLPVSFFAPPKVEFQAPILPVNVPMPMPDPLPAPTPVPDVVVREELVDTLPKLSFGGSASSVAAPPAVEAPFEEEDVFGRQLRTRRAVIAAVIAAAVVVLVLVGRSALQSSEPLPAPVAIEVIGPPVLPPLEEDEPLDLPPLSVERTMMLESALVQARALIAQGKASEGITLFETAVLEGRTKPQYLMALSRMHMDVGQLAAALQTAERVTKLYPSLADAYVLQGTVLQLQGAEWERAKPLYDKYLELAPTGVHAKDVRGILSRH